MPNSEGSELKHRHGPGCGHVAIATGGEVAYLQHGQLQVPGQPPEKVREVPASPSNPAGCTPEHGCGCHGAAHIHGPGCGHEPVPHAGHIDYLVAGHLHHPHGDHCDDHGPVQVLGEEDPPTR